MMNSTPENNPPANPPADPALVNPTAADDTNPGATIVDDDLPPVEPPSARFIAQLFLIPALIVAGIVGLFLLFNWSGSQARDWHRRGRAFHDLAQLLNSGRATQAGIPLSQHPPLATALATLTSRTLAETPAPEQAADHLQQEVLLVRLLGLIDVPESTLPVLGQTLSDNRDPAVRQAGLQAIASAGKRAIDRGATIDESNLRDGLEGVLVGKDNTLRRDATVALGIFTSTTALERLESLANDTDPIVRYNAAVSLVRQGRLRGVSVFLDTLQRASSDRDTLDLTRPKTEAEVEAFEQRWLLLQLTLKAVGTVADSLSVDQQTDLRDAIKPLAADNIPARIRIDAKRVLQQLPE
jgi:hypothetical protein